MPFKYHLVYFARIAILALLPSLLPTVVIAKDGYAAVTTENVDIQLDNLSSMLLPLDQAELETEAQAWQTVLSEKVKEISALEIQSRKVNEQLPGVLDAVGEQLKEGVAAVMPAGDAAVEPGVGTDAATPDQSNQADTSLKLGEQIAAKRLEQAALNKRFALVLDALESKGGDVQKQKLYLNAVSGIKLDTDNTTAAFLAVREWLKSEDGGLLLLMNVLKFAAVMAFVVFLSRMAGRVADRIVSRQPVSMLLENFMKVAIRRTVLAIGFIFALPIIGIDVGPLLALIGAAGLVIGLALQGTLSNFASGVLILIYRPYDMNDAVKAGDVTGVVSSMNLLFTTIKTFDNQLITIPNNSIWNDAITNITGSHQRRVDLVFGIGYDDDFAKAQDILRTILKEHPKVLETPAPNIRVNELADSSVNIICRPWAKTEDYWDVYWDVMEAAKREFDKANITIPYPQRDVHVYPAVDRSAEADKTA
ncbi:MAG: mechanosensitive ion channel family protein [Halioglobus sp.]